LQEPEAGGGVAAVVEAVQAGVQDHVPGGGIGVEGGVGVGDVVLGLRLGAGEQPLTLLNAIDVLGAAAREDVVRSGIDRIGHEAVRDRAAAVAQQDVAPVVAGHVGVIDR